MPKPLHSKIGSSFDPQWIGTPLHLWFVLSRTRDAVYRTRQRDLSEGGLTAEQTIVLGIIHGLRDHGMEDKATPAEISRQMFRESQSVSELLHRMEREGLVAKVKDLDRRNMVRIEMTKKGHELFEATLAISTASMGRIMAGLSANDRERLAKLLETIREGALQELGVEDVPIFIDFERPRKKPTPGNSGRRRNGRRRGSRKLC